jgi:hypothetical protein
MALPKLSAHLAVSEPEIQAIARLDFENRFQAGLAGGPGGVQPGMGSDGGHGALFGAGDASAK